MSSEEKAQPKTISGLLESAMRYFKKEGYKMDVENTVLDG
jgi:hypothetical protein